MMQDQPCEPVRQTEVHNAMSCLSYEISILEGLIIDLKDRLAPVRSSKPTPDEKVSATNSVMSAPLAIAIQENSDQLSRLNNILKTLHSEIEL